MITAGSPFCYAIIVFHLRQYHDHRSEMPWQSILDECIDMGYCSHKTDTCGLHVHVNRTSFRESAEEQDAVIGRILYFFEHFWSELLIFSRRTERQLNRWTSRYNCKGHPKEVLDHVKNLNPGRYTCVNLLNYSTVEFRIFRGTLKYNTLMATLQLVDEICNAAVFMSDDEIMSLKWTDFAARLNHENHAEQLDYLLQRDLITSTEETEV